jgi:hypothetical protein
MMREFHTLEFPATPDGQREKVRELRDWTAKGWKIVSETIEPGKYEDAGYCLFSICIRTCLRAPKGPGTIHVTLERDTVEIATLQAAVATAYPVLRAASAKPLPIPFLRSFFPHPVPMSPSSNHLSAPGSDRWLPTSFRTESWLTSSRARAKESMIKTWI